MVLCSIAVGEVANLLEGCTSIGDNTEPIAKKVDANLKSTSEIDEEGEES